MGGVSSFPARPPSHSPNTPPAMGLAFAKIWQRLVGKQDIRLDDPDLLEVEPSTRSRVYEQGSMCHRIMKLKGGEKGSATSVYRIMGLLALWVFLVNALGDIYGDYIGKEVRHLGVCGGNDQVWTTKPYDKGRRLLGGGGPCDGCGPPQRVNADRGQRGGADDAVLGAMEEERPWPWVCFSRCCHFRGRSRFEVYLRSLRDSPTTEAALVWRQEEACSSQTELERLVSLEPPKALYGPPPQRLLCSRAQVWRQGGGCEPTRHLLYDCWRGTRIGEVAHLGPQLCCGAEGSCRREAPTIEEDEAIRAGYDAEEQEAERQLVALKEEAEQEEEARRLVEEYERAQKEEEEHESWWHSFCRTPEEDDSPSTPRRAARETARRRSESAERRKR